MPENAHAVTGITQTAAKMSIVVSGLVSSAVSTRARARATGARQMTMTGAAARRKPSRRLISMTIEISG